MIIKIKVYTSSGKQEIIKISDKEYKAYLKNKREDNKANIELINSLAKYFNTSQMNIHIKRGKKSNKKLIQVNL